MTPLENEAERKFRARIAELVDHDPRVFELFATAASELGVKFARMHAVIEDYAERFLNGPEVPGVALRGREGNLG